MTFNSPDSENTHQSEKNNISKSKEVIVMFKKNKMLYGILALFIGFAMSFNSVNAQVTGEEEGVQTQNQVQGQVVDAETGQPLSDVTVAIEGMDQEATTDENGEFTFDNLEPNQGQQTQTEGGMGEQNPEEITFTINHEGYQEFSKTLRMDEIRQHTQQGQQQQSQMEDDLLKFELEPEQGDDY